MALGDLIQNGLSLPNFATTVSGRLHPHGHLYL